MNDSDIERVHEIAARAQIDPESLTLDEIRLVALYLLERDGSPIVASADICQN